MPASVDDLQLVVDGMQQQAADISGTWGITCWPGTGYANGDGNGITVTKSTSASLRVTEPGTYRVTYMTVDTGSHSSGTSFKLTISLGTQKADKTVTQAGNSNVYVLAHTFETSAAANVTCRADRVSGSGGAFTTHVLSAQRIK